MVGSMRAYAVAPALVGLAQVGLVLAGLALAGCDKSQDAAGTNTAPASAPASTTASAAATVASSGSIGGPIDDPALIATVIRLTQADSDACFLPDDQTIHADALDLGGGATGVVVLCSFGKDIWRRLYVRPAVGAAPVLQPMRWYDMPGDNAWHDETEIPNLEWDSPTRTFTGSVAGSASDCGSSGRWRWTGQRMALVEMKRDECDRPGEPGKTWWPTTPPTPEPAAQPKSST
ncbi:hypothetical protein BH10PSE2_BH10PSE2_00910 [soil metagenome]